MNKHLIWAITIFSIIAMICGTLIWINYNSWTVRFEMDDNTKEAIQSIEYPIMKMDDIETANYWYYNGTGRPFNDVLREITEGVGE